MIKKSSIFIIVYALFLFISVFVPNGEQLGKIALGATLAGIFFACSDTFLISAQYFGAQLDSIKKSQYELKTALLNYTDEEKSKTVEYDAWMQKIKGNEVLLDKYYKKMKRKRVAGYVSFAIGIFAFLSIITFFNADLKLFELLLKNENAFTIMAFAIVVSNYAIQDLFFVTQQKDMEAFEIIEKGK